MHILSQITSFYLLYHKGTATDAISHCKVH